ncbi:glycosyltransferase [Cobetia sp. L2A1]|uniref:glycosyltransferase n=1 Tax=Cobetia sp. L2A1 TaxID=2686360 RepID=UPI00131D54C7|nr:glycosyltransferase [Cobetia sp. L2A1]
MLAELSYSRALETPVTGGTPQSGAVPVPPAPADEATIMADWEGSLSTPRVSVMCFAFNHGDYISMALDGFLMQRTRFPFEIVVHDDASTDGTREIIEEYAARYPNIIRPILQDVNQYSQHIWPITFCMPVMRGDIIAYCEGDDYWIKADKLARQVALFDANPGATVCFHPAIEFDEHSGEHTIICRYADTVHKIPTEAVIGLRGASIPSPALTFRRMDSSVQAMLESYRTAPIMDFFLQAYMALLGDTVYYEEAACVYRRNAKGSWTSQQKEVEAELRYQREMLSAIDVFHASTRHLPDADTLYIPLYHYFKQYVMAPARPHQRVGNFYRGLGFISHMKRGRVLKLVRHDVMDKVTRRTRVRRKGEAA